MKRTLISSAVLALCLAVALVVAPAAQASVIYIDFNTISGSASGPDGAVWNVYQPVDIVSPTELVFTDGLASGLFIAADGLDTSTLNNVPSDSSLWAEPWNRDEVHDYFWRGAGQGTITLSGLDTAQLYSIEVLSQRAASGNNRTLTMTLNGEFTDSGDSENFNTYLTGHNSQRLLLWEDVYPNANGELVLAIDVPSNNFGYISGMKVTVVPEPATLLLLAGGSLLITRYRRRR